MSEALRLDRTYRLAKDSAGNFIIVSDEPEVIQPPVDLNIYLKIRKGGDARAILDEVVKRYKNEIESAGLYAEGGYIEQVFPETKVLGEKRKIERKTPTGWFK